MFGVVPTPPNLAACCAPGQFTSMVHSRKYLELDYTWIFNKAYVPVEHRPNTGCIFLVKYISVYALKIVYMSTHKKNHSLHNWIPFYYIFGVATWRWIIYANSSFSLYSNLENMKQLTKHFSINFLVAWVIDVLHTSHLVWKGKSRVQGSPHGLVQSTVVFLSLQIVSWIAVILPVGLQAGTRVHRTHNSAFYKFT